MSPLALRPRSGTELIDAAFQLLRLHYASLVTAIAVVFMPVLLLHLVLPESARPVANLISNLMQPVGAATTVVIVSDAYVGREVSVARTLRDVGSRAGAVLRAALLQGFAIMIGFILLIVPGFILFAALFAMPMAVMLEGCGASEALDRSRELTRGSRGRILLVLGLSYLICFVAAATFGGVVGIAMAGVGLSDRASDIIGELAMMLAFPPIGVVATLLYYDLRIKKEGFDLEVMASQLGLGGAQRRLNLSPNIS
jgi:hypothetical protein